MEAAAGESNCYSTHAYEERLLTRLCQSKYYLSLHSSRLEKSTASIAKGFDAVVLFVTDDGSKDVLDALKASGIKYLVLRSAWMNMRKADIAQTTLNN